MTEIARSFAITRQLELERLDIEIREMMHTIECLQDELDDLRIQRSDLLHELEKAEG